MRKAILAVIALAVILCLASVISASAFAEAQQQDFKFAQSGDVSFSFCGKNVSLCDKLNIKSLTQEQMKYLCEKFVSVADKSGLDYTSEAVGSGIKFTVSDDRFLAAFSADSRTGNDGYVNVIILGQPNSSAVLDVWKGSANPSPNALLSADAMLDAFLSNGCAVIKLASDLCPFINGSDGFTFLAFSIDNSGSVIRSGSEQFNNHDFSSGESARQPQNAPDGNGDAAHGLDKDRGSNPSGNFNDSVIAPWHIWDTGESNTHGISLNVGDTSYEWGDKGFDISHVDGGKGISINIGDGNPEHKDINIPILGDIPSDNTPSGNVPSGNDSVDVPWHGWDKGESNTGSVSLNIGDTTFEWGDKGFDVSHNEDGGDLSINVGYGDSFSVDIPVGDIFSHFHR